MLSRMILKPLNPLCMSIRFIFKSIACSLLLGFSSCESINNSISDTFKEPDSKKESEKVPPDKPIRAKMAIPHSTSESVAPIKETEEIAQKKAATNFLIDSDALAKAEQELKALPEFRGKTIHVYQSVHFYDDGRISIKVQNPASPDYVDQYDYRNAQWNTPKPVKIYLHDKLSENLVTLNRVSFTIIAKIIRTYNEKAKTVVGAKPADHSYAYISKGRIKWYPSTITGDRESYQIRFNENGTLQHYERL